MYASRVADLNRRLIGWANYLYLGPVSKAYRAVELHTCRRLRQWLCAKHQMSGQGTGQYPDVNLHEVLGLVRLTRRTASSCGSRHGSSFFPARWNHSMRITFPHRRVVAALANAPGILDLYVWLVWRSWSLAEGQQARIPLFGTLGLAQQLGSKEYGRDRDFRQKLAKWLREVKAWWPECPADGSPDGRFLIVSSARGSPAISILSDT